MMYYKWREAPQILRNFTRYYIKQIANFSIFCMKFRNCHIKGKYGRNSSRTGKISKNDMYVQFSQTEFLPCFFFFFQVEFIPPRGVRFGPKYLPLRIDCKFEKGIDLYASQNRGKFQSRILIK